MVAKQLLLTAYYHASRPVRAWNYWREASRDHLPVTVFFYHRIADDLATPWTISNDLFLRQILWLRERYEIISMADAQRRIRLGYNPQPCVCITFDDGYADNCQHAIPWLVKHRIPCTYFVTLHNVLRGECFAHDLVRNHPFLPNNVEQLKAMSAAGIEIGAHSYTHCDLGSLTDQRLLRHEVVAAKEDLEAVLGRPVRYFAFPFGCRENLHPTAFRLAKECGYDGVCSAYGGFNFPGDDAFHLQRIGVSNDMIHLKNWVTMDPRKLRTKRFLYREAGQTGSAVKLMEPAQAVRG